MLLILHNSWYTQRSFAKTTSHKLALSLFAINKFVAEKSPYMTAIQWPVFDKSSVGLNIRKIGSRAFQNIALTTCITWRVLRPMLSAKRTLKWFTWMTWVSLFKVNDAFTKRQYVRPQPWQMSSGVPWVDQFCHSRSADPGPKSSNPVGSFLMHIKLMLNNECINQWHVRRCKDASNCYDIMKM